MQLQTVKLFLRFPDGGVEVVPVVIDFTERCNLQNTKSWEDGEWHFYNTWDRKDGQTDTYLNTLKEACENGHN